MTRQKLVALTAHLSIWQHSIYLVIAENEEQCWQLYEDETGDSDRDPDSGWTKMGDGETLGILLESDGSMASDEDGTLVELPCWAWVVKYGKARYLCKEL